MKKNIYLVQPNFMYGNNAYLPYAVGAIAAYAWDNKSIKENYNLAGLIYKRDDIECTVDSFEEPFAVGFSSYIWNFEYNKEFAKKLKEKYPKCYVVFGGHNIPSHSAEFLKEWEYMDFLIHDEGEIPFTQLLLQLLEDKNFENIENISYRENGQIFKTKSSIIDETEYPSPYLTGIFDELMKDENVLFTATLETNRGCPFKCAYCDWGIYKSKLRSFPETRIKSEILWMAENKIELCMGADSNFGVLERDFQITDWLIESNRTKGYPQKFRVAYTKNSDEKVFDINRRLNAQGMSKGGTLSFQSLDENVLENIGRINISLDRFRNLLSQYNSENIPTYSEIILGLPGETFESFCNGINILLENGQHTSINIYNCELLVNSLMGNEYYIAKHGIKAMTTPLNQYHCEPNSDDVKEFSKIVVETNSMSKEMWVKSNCFAWAVQCFHCLGLLQSFAIYVYHEKGVNYSEFYLDLLDWIEHKSIGRIRQIYKEIQNKLKQISQGEGQWEYVNKMFGNLTWPFEEGAFLEFVYDQEGFYRSAQEFLKSYDIEPDIFEELLNYQKNIINTPQKQVSSCEYEYDFWGYFRRIMSDDYRPLEKKRNVLKVFDYFKSESWVEYAEKIVWYGRKGGKNICTNISQMWI